MRKVISLALVLLLTVAVLSIGFGAFAEEDTAALRFNNDGTFKILQIADTQDDAYPAADMLNLVSTAITEQKPDLVVFTGDTAEDERSADKGVDEEPTREGCLVEGDKAATKANVEKAVQDLLTVVTDCGVPFAFSQGNNDHKVLISGAEWVEIYQKYDGCLVKDESPAEEDRVDYHVEIASSDGTKTAFNLWFFDTGAGAVSADSLAWYQQQAAALAAENGGKAVPAFAFQHIPVAELGNLFEECEIWDEGAVREDGNWIRLNRTVAKGAYDAGYLPGGESDTFKAWKAQGDIIGAFFGHEHYDSFSGQVDGIELGLTYGAEFSKHGPYGIRVLTLHENDINSFDNEVYTYEGSVKTNDARFALLEDAGYATYDNAFTQALASIKFFFQNLFREWFD